MERNDPASGEPVPRIAMVTSDDGLCRLRVEERVTGRRLTLIFCSNLEINHFGDVNVKFDNRKTSDRMNLSISSDGDDVYIPSGQYLVGNLDYDEFLRRLTTANKVALQLKFGKGASIYLTDADRHWIVFSLTGSQEMLSRCTATDFLDSRVSVFTRPV